MFLGIDVGTSGVKVILTDDQSKIVDQQTVALSVSRPHPLWSEQNPGDWWQAALSAIDQIKKRRPADIANVKGFGLAGQMHGAVLLGKDNQVIRPAILWNDGRCEAECRELEAKVPNARSITGNIAMPGFTAPKLVWVAKHEPDNFKKIAKVLLPKDYVRYLFTGDFFSDMSDAAGTLWLDVAKRAWSGEMLAACGLSEGQMPVLREGSDVAGILKPELAERWGMKGDVVFAGGAGDNAAGAVGIGVLGEGQAFISLGTSGVYFAGTDQFRSCPEKTVHAFCHAVPKTWHQMGVILSAASCIKSAAQFLGAESDTTLAGFVTVENFNLSNKVVFLPYLSGERTPHNNPSATGSFFGITHETTRADLVQAILEGVAFAFADCQEALAAAGTNANDIMLIGGGARNMLWGDIISAALDKRIVYVADGDQGPAYGGAKLARMAATHESINQIANRPKVIKTVEPQVKVKSYLSPKLEKYRSLYEQLAPVFVSKN